MSLLIAVLTVLLVVCGLLVILLVMVQDDQGEGFALFGSSGQNPFNTGKNPLARMTGYFGIAFAILALVTAVAVSWSSNQRNRLEQLARPETLKDTEWFLKKSQTEAPEASKGEQVNVTPPSNASPEGQGAANTKADKGEQAAAAAPSEPPPEKQAKETVEAGG